MIKGIICFSKLSADHHKAHHIASTAKLLLSWAQKYKIPIFFEPNFPDKSFPRKEIQDAFPLTDTAISLGGDGTFLAMARMLHPAENATAQHTLVGVNLGRFGFLTEFTADEIIDNLEALKNDTAEFRLRPYICVELYTQKKKEVFYGINDAVITKASLARIIGVEIWVDQQYIGNIRGDGVIVATPTGSTGYSLAAGGPIVYPKLEAFSITPISPHTLTSRPIMAPMSMSVELKVEEKNYSEVFLSIDGQEGHAIPGGSRVTVTKNDHHLKILANPKRSYWEILREKLKLGST